MQDFGDGPSGTVYLQQLDVTVRHVTKNQSYLLQDVERVHNISDILSQIEYESAQMEIDIPVVQDHLEGMVAENLAINEDHQVVPSNLKEQRDIKKHPSSTRKFFGAIWKNKDRETEVQDTGVQREDGGISSAPQPKSSLSRLFKK